MTRAGTELAGISAGPVVTRDINSIGAKPPPLPPSRKGRGRIDGIDQPQWQCSEKLPQAGEATRSQAHRRAFRHRPIGRFGRPPLWDLWAALRPIADLPGWGLDPEAEHRLRERHRAFTRRALAAGA